MAKFLLLTILQLLVLLSPPVLFAHETQSDNGIGAILHVDPGDSPVAGQQSTLFFEFTDMEERLNLVNCECQIVIQRGEQEIFKESFSEVEGSRTSGMVDFIFPESDIYKAIVTGKPKEEGQFQSFALTFPIRVEATGPATITEAHNLPHNTWKDHALHYLPTGLVILGLILVLGYVKDKKKIAVIFLALTLLGHSVPVKAIHASHDGAITGEAFACCLPTPALTTEEVSITQEEFAFIEKPYIEISNFKFPLPNLLTIRPPPSN